jgi:mannose/cellobiose epimerase-like protein (N-acyl-D-glucosamine 2-epimerase family)
VLAMTSAYADAISGDNFYPNTEIWVTHFKEDILPYWVMQEALGTPVGNFPTFRDMSGKPGKNSDRYVRTIARQAYTYFIGYLLTGDERLISYARSGVEWIEKHAVDEKKGALRQV